MKTILNKKDYIPVNIAKNPKILVLGAREMVYSLKPWLLFQRTQVLFPAPTRQLKTVHDSSSRGSYAHFLPPQTLDLCVGCLFLVVNLTPSRMN